MYNIGDIVELKDGRQVTIKDVRNTGSGIIYGIGFPTLELILPHDIIRKIED